MKPPALSIDYGTSNTVAVLRRPDGQLRPLLFGASPLLPSAVYAGPGGELLTGVGAVRKAAEDPAACEPYPKRRIDDGTVLLGGNTVTVPDLIAVVLARVLREAHRVAGAPPDPVVITHPAAWGSRRTSILLDAAGRAGIHAPVLVPEPVAACVHFGSLPGVPARPGEHLAVFDLGAGTFDVTVVRHTTTGFEVVVADGLDDLGGADLDELVVNQIALSAAAAAPREWERLMNPETVEDRRRLFQLRDAAKHAKETLSYGPVAELHIPGLGRDTHVTRAEFDRAATPLLERAVAVTKAVLDRAGVGPEDLRGLFLVGGASRVPLAATLLHRALGHPPTVLDQPELAVAEGGLPAADPTTPAEVPATATSAAPPTIEPAVAPRRPVGPRWSHILDVDSTPERRRVVLQSLIFLIPGVVGLLVATDIFVNRPREDFAAAIVIVLVTGLVMAFGAARYFNAPDRDAEITVDVDRDGIAVTNDDFTVTRAWNDIEAVGTFHDGRLAIRSPLDEHADDSFRLPGITFDGDLLLIGPIAPDLWDDLATVLDHYAGDSFARFGIAANP